MTRLALPDFDGPYPQYYSIVTKLDGTVLGQVRSINPADSLEVLKAGRVGSSTKKTLRKSKDTNVSVELWIDQDLAEVATFLGYTSTPTTGETIKLAGDNDPVTMLVKNYDAEALAANLKSTVYLYGYVATKIGFTLDEDGEQVASISGGLEDLYWVVA